ncbi:MAG: ribosome silencing factor [Planctomycetota bacterium]|nr:ribosome silencing factor [Planctomycetota bacterium]MDE1888867.1 ribosome silencing factor [Planctomycetota bacterium]MDE2215642.1 ribosome silencing factor [Planctomycetota bacterium]
MILTLSNRRDRFSGGTETLDSKEIAILCARIADNKKAEDILIFGVGDLTFIADFFVICSGFNKRQLQSIANDIELKLGSYGIRWIGMEGYTDALWILIDYGDVIVHLFDKDMRQFYDLELLWGDAPKLQWKPTL